ncbi:hypothetical protein BGZ63DRAFT_427772 [Mariannaea sp. PMI_226]|nr:hypothetical protein BGZ63DRAFT_427772 [Mariannaea sp. PMI_226]
MTRLYGASFVCESCHRPGPFGWLYRCTQDREELIEEAASRGFTTAFDDLGRHLTAKLGTRKGSPAAREDKLSFLTEASPQVLATYQPNQLATILRQREHLKSQIYKERIRKKNADMFGPFRQTSGREKASSKIQNPSRPWVCADDEECQFKVCPLCRPSYADRSFISLDSVLHGELPPTAATGFGFHIIGERPVVDANLVRTLGLRRPPAKPHSESNFSEGSFPSDPSMVEMLNDQLRRCKFWGKKYSDIEIECDRILSLLPSIPGQLIHSSRCDNLKSYGPSQSDDLHNEEHPCESLIKEPAHPPPQGEITQPHQSLSGFKIDCVVMDHDDSISTPRPNKGTDHLTKVSGPRVESLEGSKTARGSD